MLVGLLNEHPDLNIDLLLLPRFANLANREADIGVMLDPPSTGRYMVTKMASFRMYFCMDRKSIWRGIHQYANMLILRVTSLSTMCKTDWRVVSSTFSMNLVSRRAVDSAVLA